MEILMSSSSRAADSCRTRRSPSFSDKRVVYLGVAILAGMMALGAAYWWFWASSRGGGEGEARGNGRAPGVVAEPLAVQPREQSRTVRLSADQQRAIGLRTAPVTSGMSYDVLTAPGRVAPNESQFAYITPRAAGVVRSVTAYIGQDVKSGNLLATIDSPEVGNARLEFYTRQQALEVAKAQAGWQDMIYRNTLELIERLEKGETPEQIHTALAQRAVGENRERLMTAYAQYRLAIATIERNRELFAQKLITPKQFEQVNASYEVAQATYQSLMDQMGYETRLANTRAHQAKKQAETSVRAAQERLRILGVKPNGTEPEVKRGNVVGVKPDGTLQASHQGGSSPSIRSETVLPLDEGKGNLDAATPVSTYSIWAPFDGTILDREMIVPGVAVDMTHRIFTMANLVTVWVETDIHESDFDSLARSRGGKIRFRSPAYPGREFDGEVTYTGDLVDEKSRTVKLLARAKNPDRLLKPGMFVEVQVLSPRGKTAPLVPAAALLTQGNQTIVYVRTGPDRFTRREVDVEPPRGDTTVARSGLEPGEEVVVEGGFKLKSMAVQFASAER
jgi:cobalt-zinc-cadmium efflux system membrane fusion protein